MQGDDGQHRRVERPHTGAQTDAAEIHGRKTADTVYQAATIAAALLLLFSAAITMI